jgi:FKBP-type peptidyl-prolyl cis-trans isomerase FklB
VLLFDDGTERIEMRSLALSLLLGLGACSGFAGDEEKQAPSAAAPDMATTPDTTLALAPKPAEPAPAPKPAEPAPAPKPVEPAPAPKPAEPPPATPAAQPATAAAPAQPAQPAGALATARERGSYAIGLNVGKNVKTQSIDLDIETFLKGLKDGMSGAKPALTTQEIGEAMQNLQKEAQAKRAVAGEKNKQEGEAFLAENAKKPGIVTLPSGLQYKVLVEGTGPKPKPTDQVSVNYRGTLINGTEFDSSYSRGEPATFRVTGVIKGWSEALQLMTVGAKWQLFIPASIAYGERGAGGDIGPNSALIFDVELLSIKEAPPTPPPGLKTMTPQPKTATPGAKPNFTPVLPKTAAPAETKTTTPPEPKATTPPEPKK